MNESSSTHDVYTLVTDRIVTQLEQGNVPWRRPWAIAGLPQNIITKIPYRGINVWMLAGLNYAQNSFITWKQVKELGASVKRGEKGHLVVFWKKKEEEVSEEKPKQTSVLRYYWVFNISQCEGIPPELIPAVSHPNDPIKACDEIIAAMPLKPKIQHKESHAYYQPLEDYVNMPKLKTFISSESYYSTLFHELVHSTGHSTRLNRTCLAEMAEFGSEAYSIEELVAEIGACYLTSYAGIEAPFENNVAYISGWLQKLKNDKRFVFTASTQAQKAIDFILNVPLVTAK